MSQSNSSDVELKNRNRKKCPEINKKINKWCFDSSRVSDGQAGLPDGARRRLLISELTGQGNDPAGITHTKSFSAGVFVSTGPGGHPVGCCKPSLSLVGVSLY